MNKTINLNSTKRANTASRITLRDWLAGSFNNDDLEMLFANMDSAMKYIHSKGYCIRSFNPKDIEILNDSLKHIRFNSLMMMPDDFVSKKTIVKEDIGRSTFLQIGIYGRCLNCLDPDFLKSHFNDFAIFLPENLTPYYRGVVERGASVYLGDYLNEKRKRDLEALEREVGESMDGSTSTKHFVKSNGTSMISDKDSMNAKVNDSIYKQLNSMSDAAFISFLMIPTLVAILGLIFAIVVILSQ